MPKRQKNCQADKLDSYMARGRLNVNSVLKALQECKGFVSHTAKKLGCSRQSLYDFFKKNPKVKQAQEDCVNERGDDIVLAQYNRAVGTRAIKYDDEGNEFIYEVLPDPTAAKLCLTYNHGYEDKSKQDINLLTKTQDELDELRKDITGLDDEE